VGRDLQSRDAHAIASKHPMLSFETLLIQHKT
jgi:hypothetical protein